MAITSAPAVRARSPASATASSIASYGSTETAGPPGGARFVIDLERAGQFEAA